MFSNKKYPITIQTSTIQIVNSMFLIQTQVLIESKILLEILNNNILSFIKSELKVIGKDFFGITFCLDSMCYKDIKG